MGDDAEGRLFPVALRASSWRHPDRAIEPHGFAIEHRIFRDVKREGSIFVGAAKPCRVWHLLGETGTHFLAQSHQHRSKKQARRDSIHPDPDRREIAHNRLRHSGDARL